MLSYAVNIHVGAIAMISRVASPVALLPASLQDFFAPHFDELSLSRFPFLGRLLRDQLY